MKCCFKSALLLCLLSFSATVSAQVRVQQVQIQQNIGGGLGGDPADVEGAMRIEVDTIRRVTGLSDAAAKKLEVAALAALKAATKKADEVQLALPGLNEDTGAGQTGNTLSDEDAERSGKNAKNAPDQPAPFPAMRTLDAKKVKEEAIWAKSFAAALSPEQHAVYEKFLAQRATLRRRAAVENKVNELDDSLSFTADQRTAITELVDRKLGEALAKIQRPAGMFGGGQVVMVMAGQQHDLNTDDLKPVLSPVQMAEYKRKQELAAQGPFGAMQRALPAAVNAQLGLAASSQSNLGFTYADKDKGVEVVTVEDGSEAAKMGLQVGDLVDEVQGAPTDTSIQLKRALAKRGKETLKLRVKRGEKIIELVGEVK